MARDRAAGCSGAAARDPPVALGPSGSESRNRDLDRVSGRHGDSLAGQASSHPSEPESGPSWAMRQGT